MLFRNQKQRSCDCATYWCDGTWRDVCPSRSIPRCLVFSMPGISFPFRYAWGGFFTQGEITCADFWSLTLMPHLRIGDTDEIKRRNLTILVNIVHSSSHPNLSSWLVQFKKIHFFRNEFATLNIKKNYPDTQKLNESSMNKLDLNP